MSHFQNNLRDQAENKLIPRNAEIKSPADDLFTDNKIKTVSREEALSLLEGFKSAVMAGDKNAIDSVCSLLKEGTSGTDLNSIVNHACDSLFDDNESHNYAILKYTAPIGENSIARENITIIREQSEQSRKAFIYVDNDEFDQFDDSEFHYIASFNIDFIHIINPTTGRRIYSGPLDADFTVNTNTETDKRDGWMILLCVIVLITMGLCVRHSVRS